jgi:hypothetical protein
MQAKRIVTLFHSSLGDSPEEFHQPFGGNRPDLLRLRFRIQGNPDSRARIKSWNGQPVPSEERDTSRLLGSNRARVHFCEG